MRNRSPDGAQRNPGSVSRLAEACLADRGVAGPVPRQQSPPYVTVKRRGRPVGDARGQTMFERIDMDVVDMAREIALVADRVLPRTAAATRRTHPCGRSETSRQRRR